MDFDRESIKNLSVVIITLILSTLTTAGCETSDPFVIPTAIINTSIAAGASAARRSQGECYTWCEKGTACNPKTGFCEPLPCYGSCKSDERCDESLPIPKCVPHTTGDLNIDSLELHPDHNHP